MTVEICTTVATQPEATTLQQFYQKNNVKVPPGPGGGRKFFIKSALQGFRTNEVYTFRTKKRLRPTLNTDPTRLLGYCRQQNTMEFFATSFFFSLFSNFLWGFF